MKNTISRITCANREEAKRITASMTLREKVRMRSGRDGWHTVGIERLNLPEMLMTDGPHGLRTKKDHSRNVSAENTKETTCFPPAVASSCSFDRDLLCEMGVAMGEECVSEGVSVLLGPGINIKRSPLCGRNFEYFSEDPFLAGNLASALVNGVQSQNVGTSIKHFLANSEETERLTGSSEVDERALREIYMPAFEHVVKHAQPWTLMCSYNRINGIFASINKRMLTDILRGEWGYEGLVVSDWGAMDDRRESVMAGLDLEMPVPRESYIDELEESCRSGELSVAALERCVERTTALVLQTMNNKVKDYDRAEHDALSRRIARESAVLLENDGTLPLNKGKKIAVIGGFAKNPRYQGAGSSLLVPTHITSPLEAFSNAGISFEFAEGYDGLQPSSELIAQAVAAAKSCGSVVCFVGLPDEYESEGYDRDSISLPPSHNALVDALIEASVPLTVVVLAGGVTELPWRKKVNALLLMTLGGQNVGGAAYDLLFGDYSPCGKLSETYPLALADSPSYANFATEFVVPYKESIYVGYRYYDKAGLDVAYEFGFGRSYAEFEYSELKVEDCGDYCFNVSAKVKNTGKMRAKEIVQLYVKPPQGAVFRPVRELKGFEKLELEPGEEKTVHFTTDSRSFAFYNVNIKDWQVIGGSYALELAASSRDIRLEAVVSVAASHDCEAPDYRQSSPSYYEKERMQPPYNVPNSEFESVFGTSLEEAGVKRPFTRSSTLRDIQTSVWGAKIADRIVEDAKRRLCGDSSDREHIERVMVTPLRCTIMFPYSLEANKVDAIIAFANGDPISGTRLWNKMQNR